MRIRLLLPFLVLPLTGACVAKTAWNVATAPVKAGGKVVDWTTTSQDEADRNYGRKMRKKEELRKKEEMRKKREQNECG